jgi:hypothetical protein
MYYIVLNTKLFPKKSSKRLWVRTGLQQIIVPLSA